MQEFAAAGQWWLPSKPETSVFGKLTFVPHEGVSLDIPAGTLGDVTDMVERVNRMGSPVGSSKVGSVFGILKDGPFFPWHPVWKCLSVLDELTDLRQESNECAEGSELSVLCIHTQHGTRRLCDPHILPCDAEEPHHLERLLSRLG